MTESQMKEDPVADYFVELQTDMERLRFRKLIVPSEEERDAALRRGDVTTAYQHTMSNSLRQKVGALYDDAERARKAAERARKEEEVAGRHQDKSL